MSNSSEILAMAREAQKKKVMKGPKIDIDIDKLIAGTLGSGGPPKKTDGNDSDDDAAPPRADSDDDAPPLSKSNGAMDAAATKRAAIKENTVDELLSEYAADPNAKVKVKNAVVKRYPLFGLRKVFGCAHIDLHTAVLEGDIPYVRKTLRRIAKKNPDDVNEYDVKGRTALSLAVKEGRGKCVWVFRFFATRRDRSDNKTRASKMRIFKRGWRVVGAAAHY